MARKRMISPEMWESQSFGELSLLAKVLFIGMISQADDDGRGILNPQLLKSRILPYDELRVADIDKALQEIGHKESVDTDSDKAREEASHKLSVRYYEIGGRWYYLFENWTKWQSIQKPIPSKLPSPPMRGVGEELRSDKALRYDYSRTTVGLREDYSLIEERKEKKGREISAQAREGSLSLLSNAGIEVDCEVPSNVDFVSLIDKVKTTPYLRQWKYLSKYLKYYDKIIAGYYDAYGKPQGAIATEEIHSHKYTDEQLQSVVVNFNEWEDE